MKKIEQQLQACKLTEESLITIILNSNNKSMIKEILPIVRRYTNAIVINYSGDLTELALVRVGDNTFPYVS
jgi:hypothetical protein